MKHLVVAYHDEDITWTMELDGWRVHPVCNGIDRPNTGREAGAYLWWIVNHYFNLNPASTYAFIQGNPFDHEPYIIKLMEKPCDQWVPLGGYEFHTDEHGGPDHWECIPVGPIYSMVTGKPFPRHGLQVHAGAQFMMPGSVLLEHSHDMYKWCLDRTRTDPLAPWAFERVWAAMFGEEAS